MGGVYAVSRRVTGPRPVRIQEQNRTDDLSYRSSTTQLHKRISESETDEDCTLQIRGYFSPYPTWYPIGRFSVRRHAGAPATGPPPAGRGANGLAASPVQTEQATAIECVPVRPGPRPQWRGALARRWRAPRAAARQAREHVKILRSPMSNVVYAQLGFCISPLDLAPRAAARRRPGASHTTRRRLSYSLLATRLSISGKCIT